MLFGSTWLGFLFMIQQNIFKNTLHQHHNLPLYYGCIWPCLQLFIKERFKVQSSFQIVFTCMQIARLSNIEPTQRVNIANQNCSKHFSEQKVSFIVAWLQFLLQCNIFCLVFTLYKHDASIGIAITLFNRASFKKRGEKKENN